VLKLLARSSVVEAGDCLSKRIHLSHDIVNELCNLIGQRVLRLVLDKISSLRAISKYSISADETRDASGTEQLTVCLRWVDNSLSVQANFLRLYSLSGLGESAEIITKCLKDVLICCQLQFSDLHGQGYDGGSVMSGAVSGVARSVKEFRLNLSVSHFLCIWCKLNCSSTTHTYIMLVFYYCHAKFKEIAWSEKIK